MEQGEPPFRESLLNTPDHDQRAQTRLVERVGLRTHQPAVLQSQCHEFPVCRCQTLYGTRALSPFKPACPKTGAWKLTCPSLAREVSCFYAGRRSVCGGLSRSTEV